MESDRQLEETTSVYSRQSSGIRAVPSFDDDSDEFYDDSDDDPLFANISLVNETIENDENTLNSTSITSTNYNGGLNLNSGTNGSSVIGGDEFGTSVTDPDEKITEKTVLVDKNSVSGSGPGLGLSGSKGLLGSTGRLGSVPIIAKVSNEDEDDENEGSSEEEGVGFSGGYGVRNTPPRVRVLGEDDMIGIGESTDEDASEFANETEEESGVLELKSVGVESNEKGLPEESASVDVAEVEETKDTEIEMGNARGSDVAESGLPVSRAVESSPADVGEGVRSGDNIVEEVEEGKEKSVTDDSVLLDDSVVDEIKVDPVEVVRSGVAVVGDSGGEGMGTEVKEVGAPGDDNVTLGNEFELLVDSNSEPLIDNEVESTANEESKMGEVNRVESDVESEEHQPTSGLKVVSGSDDGKIQPGDVDKPQSNSAQVGEEGTKSRSGDSAQLEELDASNFDKAHLNKNVEQNEALSPKIGAETEDDKSHVFQEDIDGENTDASDASRFMEELQHVFDSPERVESQIGADSEEEAESDDEGEEKEMFDSATLAALLKAATSTGSDSGTITITSQDGSPLFSVERPAGLGTSVRSVRPASRPSNSSPFTPFNLAAPSEENLTEEEKKKLQLMHQLRVKFLRLVQRLGYTVEDSVAAQVLYRLALLAGRPTSSTFSLDNAKQTATQLEAEGKDDLDFFLTILVIGKTGVGKSATINSIFGEEKVKINAFEPETTSVNEIRGVIDGVKIRVIDAPGLKTSGMEQKFNRKVLASVKNLIKKNTPDIMLYVDRLDLQTRDLNDLPLLRTITSSLGGSIWRSAIVTLTHASCAPPDGPSGSPLSYEVFVAQRTHIIQQSIGQAVGDLRLMNPSLMNPVSLVENHPACRKNQEGQRVLPNGQAWKQQLLLLCYSLKILSEANAASKSQDSFDQQKLFGFRVRSIPLPYMLSTMLQPRAYPKLPADQGGDNGDSDIDLDVLSDSDQEEEDEYDQLPPFKPLRKFQIAQLSKDQREAYFEEYDYRVKLLQRKQWKEELKRMKEMKKKGNTGMDGYSESPYDFDADSEAPAAVQVPLPDMVLPPSFDSDNPAYRYRFLEPTSQFSARPVLDTHGWDHDCGYDGVNLEQNLGIAGRFPAAVTAQVTKDKKDCNFHLDSSVSAKHKENGSSLLGFDVQTIGKQPAYIIRGESKFKTHKRNKTGAGLSVTFLGENVATGAKIEDQLHVGKRLVLLGSVGTVRSQKDAAYGANLEVQLREEDYPIEQDQSSINLSLMKWRGDLAIGANLQSQFSVGRSSKMAVRISLNNKRSGQVSVRTSSSDNLQLAFAGLIPIFLCIFRNVKPSGSENYSLY